MSDSILRIAANPIIWAVAYLMWRVFFTAPGRRPLDEDMTNG